MKRLLLNGSPRGKSSNSRLILSWIASGLAEGGAGTDIPVLDLARTADIEDQIGAVLDADEVVLAFPLYTDSSPAVVKNFLERMAAIGPGRLVGKRFGFVVQSGFPESIHSENTAAWERRFDAPYGPAADPREA